MYIPWDDLSAHSERLLQNICQFFGRSLNCLAKDFVRPTCVVPEDIDRLIEVDGQRIAVRL